ncbi:MAG: VWA domain-containing protein [Acidobacteriota bacterium]|nr:VWA domain-containing protein [Acidobacteriota bacterium]
MLRSFPVFVAAALLFPLLAQEPDNSTIRANVPLVLAPVTVTDKKGNFIDGLSVEDFRLNDDGIPQKIHMDTSDTVLAPVSLMVLIQASGISAPALARIERVGGLIKPLVIGQRGQAAVIEFDDEIRVRADFTSDPDLISAAFQRIRSRSIRTARLVDAVAQGITMLNTRSPNNRRVMLVLSESRDRGSRGKLGELIEQAQRAGVVVYAATYSVQGSTFLSSPSTSPSMPGGDGNVNILGGARELARIGKANVAEALARTTGGRHLSFLTLGSLESVISRAGEEIHSQYLLSFTPTPSTKDGFHQIQVAIPSHPDAIVRVRMGYWPQK